MAYFFVLQTKTADHFQVAYERISFQAICSLSFRQTVCVYWHHFCPLATVELFRRVAQNTESRDFNVSSHMMQPQLVSKEAGSLCLFPFWYSFVVYVVFGSKIRYQM